MCKFGMYENCGEVEHFCPLGLKPLPVPFSQELKNLFSMQNWVWIAPSPQKALAFSK